MDTHQPLGGGDDTDHCAQQDTAGNTIWKSARDGGIGLLDERAHKMSGRQQPRRRPGCISGRARKLRPVIE